MSCISNPKFYLFVIYCFSNVPFWTHSKILGSVALIYKVMSFWYTMYSFCIFVGLNFFNPVRLFMNFRHIFIFVESLRCHEKCSALMKLEPTVEPIDPFPWFRLNPVTFLMNWILLLRQNSYELNCPLLYERGAFVCTHFCLKQILHESFELNNLT